MSLGSAIGMSLASGCARRIMRLMSSWARAVSIAINGRKDGALVGRMVGVIKGFWFALRWRFWEVCMRHACMNGMKNTPLRIRSWEEPCMIYKGRTTSRTCPIDIHDMAFQSTASRTSQASETLIDTLPLRLLKLTPEEIPWPANSRCLRVPLLDCPPFSLP